MSYPRNRRPRLKSVTQLRNELALLEIRLGEMMTRRADLEVELASAIERFFAEQDAAATTTTPDAGASR
jgi:hypothetical protein